MLAAHLHKLNRASPVRYAVNTRDPQLMEAIRNYLGIRIRGSELPAQSQRDPEIAGMHQQYPVMGHTFHSLLQSGHPVDLMAYLDMMGEMAGSPLHQNHPFANTLEGMSHYVGTEARHPEIARLFGQQAVESPGLLHALQQHLQERPGIGAGSHLLHSALPPGHPLRGSLSAILRTLYPAHGSANMGPGAVPAIMRGHDVAHAMLSGMQDLGHTLPQTVPIPNLDINTNVRENLRHRTSNTLREIIWPHLAHAPGGM